LPAKHIDTGMGFERLCMVLQGVKSNYDSDVFTPLIRKIEKITHTTYGKNTETDIAIRVVADHVRAVTFSIADGQLPSNTGAGYVIRRILRRAIRYGFTFLNQKDAFIYQLVDTLSEQMGEVFPELIKEKNLITNVIREEEQSFLKTLEQGLLLLNDLTKNMEGKRLSGAKAFELYDTFGFPIDLTALILSEKGYDLDVKEFEVALQNQKNRSRAAAEITKDDWTILFDKNETIFVGYDQLECQSKITRYRKIDSKKDGKLYQIVLDETPFYPEGGGQVGDQGVLVSAHEQIKIIDTKKENNLIVHTTDSLPKNPHHTFTAKVDVKLRKLSEANHSATHLMHQALREVLGTNVEQKGSLVSPNHLRFDFSHFAKMTDEELQKVEVFVNARIAENLPLEERRKVPFAEAVSEGAMALFGEKYGDSVRAIRFGNSIELCGGTHVKNTADIWHFKIVSEGAVASGIRRIEAITSDAVKAYFDNQATQLEEIKQLLKNPIHPTKALQLILEENNSIKKQIDALLREKALGMKGELEAELEDLNGVKFLAKKIDLEQNALKDLVFELGKSHDNLFVLLATQPDNDKVMLTCYISKELTEKRGYDAGKVVRELGKLIHGGGGGQAFFATAGGKNPGGIPKALERAKDYLV
ncbi:MAG: alanine--tRNA ligase, partial [Bacteroidetes bacterium HGW-Bacteroidetes-13]